MLTAIRRALSAVSTLACIASVSEARLYTYASVSLTPPLLRGPLV
jgi:hypothetical protein